MLLENPQANSFGSAEYGAMHHRSPERRAKGNYWRDVFGPLPGNRSGEDAAQAVTDEMNSLSGLGQRGFYGFIQMSLDEEVRTFCIDAYAGKIRTVPDSSQPGMQFHQVKIRT